MKLIKFRNSVNESKKPKPLAFQKFNSMVSLIYLRGVVSFIIRRL